MKLSKEYIRRCIVLIIALFVCGFGITFVRMSCLGMEPFTALCYAFSKVFNCPMGYLSIGINLLIIVFSFIYVKELLGLGTICAMIGVGYSTDFWGWGITNIIGHDVAFNGWEALPLRLLLFIIGLVFMTIPTSFILASDVGIAPYDTVGYIFEKKSRGKIKFKTARVVQDSLTVVITFVAASTIGIQWQIIGFGTILLAFFVGPLLSFLRENIATPFIMKACKL